MRRYDFRVQEPRDSQRVARPHWIVPNRWRHSAWTIPRLVAVEFRFPRWGEWSFRRILRRPLAGVDIAECLKSAGPIPMSGEIVRIEVGCALRSVTTAERTMNTVIRITASLTSLLRREPSPPERQATPCHSPGVPSRGRLWLQRLGTDYRPIGSDRRASWWCGSNRLACSSHRWCWKKLHSPVHDFTFSSFRSK